MGCIQNLFRVWDDRRDSMKSISHSQFSAYNECNLKWKLRYIDKLSKFSGSIHTVFGTVCTPRFKHISLSFTTSQSNQQTLWI